MKKHRFGQTLTFFEQSGMFLRFDQVFGKTLKMCLMSSKILHLGKTWLLSNKLACFCVLINFSAKRFKKCFISRKTMKNRPFGQNLQLFQQTGMFVFLDELFSKKIQKVPHFEKKLSEIVDLAEVDTFRRNWHVLAFWSSFQEKVAKSASFPKKHEKSSIWPKHSTFRTNWHVFLFWWTFQRKVERSALFREKPWEIMNLGKTWHFSNKVTCFCVLIKFSAKTCKKCLISWKTMKNNGFGQNLQFFAKTGMFLRFDQRLSRKLQKVPHLMKKHEK